MSDNVTPLHPEQERRRKNRKRVLTLAGIVLLVCAVLCLILFRQELNLDKIRRYVTYLGKEGSGTYGEYIFDAHSANSYAAFDNGLALATVAGLEVFDPYGEPLCTVNRAMSVPVLAVGKNTVLAYDVGGTAICAAGANSTPLLSMDLVKPILDADISGGDAVCYAVAEDGYKTVLTVLSSEQKQTYQWLSSTQYLPLCAISDSGKRLGAVSLGQTEGIFNSSAVLFSTEQEEPLATLSLGNQLIYDLDFVDEKILCAIGENGLVYFDDDGNAIGEYGYNGQYLRDYSMHGSGFVTLILNQYKAGNRYSIVTVDNKGQELSSLYLGEEVLSISAAGNYVAVLGAGKLYIYTADLKPYAETEQVFGASDVVMRADGSAILIGGGAAKLYLP